MMSPRKPVIKLIIISSMTGLAQACAGCALPAVVPDAMIVTPLATRLSVTATRDVPMLASLAPDAQAPPPRALA